MNTNKWLRSLSFHAACAALALAGACEQASPQTDPDKRAQDTSESAKHKTDTKKQRKSDEPRYAVTLELAPEAVDRIPRSGVALAFSRIANTKRSGAKARFLHGWVSPHGDYYGPGLPRAQYKVEARAAGKATRLEGSLDYTYPNRLPPLRLDVTDTLRAVVRLEDEETRLPVADAKVTLALVDCTGLCPPTDLSTHSGAFVAEGLPAGTYELTVNAAGYVAPRVRRLELRDSISVIERSLEPGVVVAGQVASKGAPIGDARVVATQDHGRGWTEARTDAAGQFQLGPMSAGEYYFAVAADGFAPHVEKGWRTDDGSGSTVELGTGTSLAGTVTDESDLPLAGVRVEVDPGQPDFGDLLRQSSVTDDRGHYRFSHLAERTTHLIFARSSSVAVRHPIAQLRSASPDTAAVTQLDHDRGWTELAVVDDRGRPLAGARIEIQNLGSTLLAANSDRGGLVRFRGARGAEHRVVATHEGHAEYRGMVPADNTQLPITLSRLSRLSGTVAMKGLDWLPDGARVVLRRGKQKLSTSVRDGQFDTGPIKPGKYKVRVELFDLSKSKSRTIELASGDNVADVGLTLPAAQFRPAKSTELR